MQIDRAKFLLLTSTIAAGHIACAGETPPPQEPTMLTVPPPAIVAAPTAAPATTSSIGKPDVRVRGGSPATEGGVEDDDVGTGSIGTLGHGAGLADTGPACPVVTGAIGDCSTLRAPGPQCESFKDTKDACAKYATALQPRVAQKAVACMLAKSGTRAICDFQLESKCVVAALPAACPDPALGPQCDMVINNCRGGRGRAGVSKDACVRALSAVSSRSRSRSELLTCMMESCAVDNCFFGLL